MHMPLCKNHLEYNQRERVRFRTCIDRQVAVSDSYIDKLQSCMRHMHRPTSCSVRFIHTHVCGTCIGQLPNSYTYMRHMFLVRIRQVPCFFIRTQGLFFFLKLGVCSVHENSTAEIGIVIIKSVNGINRNGSTMWKPYCNTCTTHYLHNKDHRLSLTSGCTANTCIIHVGMF